MVKIKELSDKQLSKQLEKHEKIMIALKREKEKRCSDKSEVDISLTAVNIQESSGELTQERVRKVGTVSNMRITRKKKSDRTSSSLYQLTINDDDLDSMAEIAEKIQKSTKQVTISKLIELSHDNSVIKVRDVTKKSS